MATRSDYPNAPWPAPPQAPRTLSPWLLRAPILLFCGLALFCFVMAGVVGLIQLQYDGLVYPGVSSMGMDLGGRPPQDIFNDLSIVFTYPDTATFERMSSGSEFQNDGFTVTR